MNDENGRSIVHGIPGFWRMVETAPERALVLDYDGTLAPFEADRMQAWPLEGVVEDLRAIRDSGRTKLAVVTGRPLNELLSLLGDLGIPVVGSHGFEVALPGGVTERGELTPSQMRRLEEAEREAHELAPGARVERKPGGVGLHTRGMPEDVSRRLRDLVCEAWTRGAAELGLECRRFAGGVELRVLGADKGSALRRLLGDLGGAALCVYLGDDETDEDAFEELDGTGESKWTGIGIKIGPPGARTRARGRLDDPRAVKEFLSTWISVTT